jgi:hypothetical protein
VSYDRRYHVAKERKLGYELGLVASTGLVIGNEWSRYRQPTFFKGGIGDFDQLSLTSLAGLLTICGIAGFGFHIYKYLPYVIESREKAKNMKLELSAREAEIEKLKKDPYYKVREHCILQTTLKEADVVVFQQAVEQEKRDREFYKAYVRAEYDLDDFETAEMNEQLFKEPVEEAVQRRMDHILTQDGLILPNCIVGSVAILWQTTYNVVCHNIATESTIQSPCFTYQTLFLFVIIL